jgi:hypothetical protein
VINQPSLRIRQHDTHEELVGQADSPVPLSSGAPDAIIVPASRPAEHLGHAIRLAQAAGCRLVVLCSRKARAGEVSELLASRSFTASVVIDLPPGYGHHWLEFATSHPQKIGHLPEPCAARDSDLSIKRNIGLILARMLGWDRVFFMDDDITNVSVDALHRTVSMLGRHYHTAGMRVTEFPDNSVVCHAHRATGRFQDVLVSGSVLAVDCTAPMGFFPDVYNEDWLFFYDDVVEHRLGSSGLEATQLRYDPFDLPERAARQEFGDVLAEGLYALLHRRQNTAYATQDYWINFLDARMGFLDAIIARADRAPAEVQLKLLNSVRAARQCTAQIEPEFCEHYVRLWRKDLGRWEQTLTNIPRVSSIAKALSELALAPDGHDGGGGQPAHRTHVATPASTAQAPTLFSDVAMPGYVPVDTAVLARRAAADAETTLEQEAIPLAADIFAAGDAASSASRLAVASSPFVLIATLLGARLTLTADLTSSRSRHGRHRRTAGGRPPWRLRSRRMIAAGRDAARMLASRMRRRRPPGLQSPDAQQVAKARAQPRCRTPATPGPAASPHSVIS